MSRQMRDRPNALCAPIPGSTEPETDARRNRGPTIAQNIKELNRRALKDIRRVLSRPSTPHRSAGLPRVNPGAFQRAISQRHGRNDGIRTYGHTRPNKCARANPNPILQNNRSVTILHVRRAIVVVAGTKETAL